MTTILRIIAWLLAAAVTFATLGPPRLRPHAAEFGQDGEHALAFILVGLAFGANGEMAVATNDSVYSLPLGIHGTLLD